MSICFYIYRNKYSESKVLISLHSAHRRPGDRSQLLAHHKAHAQIERQINGYDGACAQADAVSLIQQGSTDALLGQPSADIVDKLPRHVNPVRLQSFHELNEQTHQSEIKTEAASHPCATKQYMEV